MHADPPGTLKLRDHVGHRWWGFVLAMNFFLAPLGALAVSRVSFDASPPLTYIFWAVTLLVSFYAVLFVVSLLKQGWRGGPLWRASLIATFVAALVCAYLIQDFVPPPELSPLFWFLLLAGSFTVGIFFLFVGEYVRTAYQWKRGHEVRDVTEEEWAGVPWPARANAVLHGVIRLEFFGWVIWVTSAVTAIAGALRNAPMSDPTFAHLGYLQKYFRTLDFAAYDLIRATVIGTIVIFFVQLLKTYQNAIIAAEKAATDAGQAAKDAEKAIGEAQRILPTLNAQMQKTIEVFKTTGAVSGVAILANDVAQNLAYIAKSDAALTQVRELSERLIEHFSRINREVSNSYNIGGQASHFDLISLSAIYTTYLKVEALSFEGGEVGQGGIRLSTRYPHYLLAVHSLVGAIYRLDPARYGFYTVTNREPQQFFNPERADSAQASVDWTVLFLERFCRWHHRKNIPYARHFVTYERGPLPPRDDLHGGQKGPSLHGIVDEQLERNYILCSVRDGQVRPCLWGEAAWAVIEGGYAGVPSVWSYLSEQEAEDLKKAMREAVPRPEVRAALASVDMLRDITVPSYVIVNRERKAKFDSIVRQYESEIAFVPLKDALLEYHSRATPPQKLVFEYYADYEQFFKDVIPRDMLAVWDKQEQCWCLCIGTMVGDSDPNAVVMFVTSKERRLKNLPWEDLMAKLSALFCANAASDECNEITREEIG